MKRFNYLLSIFALSFLLTFTSCSDDDDDKDTAMEYVLTESMFNTATNAIQTNINNGARAHNGDSTMTGTDTFRDVFTNMSDVNGQASPGDIIIKRVYGKDENGDKNINPSVAFAMVKQESGFGDDSGNWYWYRILSNESGEIDYSTSTKMDIAACFSCHNNLAGAEKDYRFIYAN